MAGIACGDRVKLEVQVGYREAGERGLVLEVSETQAVVQFDRRDTYGAAVEVVRVDLLDRVEREEN